MKVQGAVPLHASVAPYRFVFPYWVGELHTAPSGEHWNHSRNVQSEFGRYWAILSPPQPPPCINTMCLADLVICFKKKSPDVSFSVMIKSRKTQAQTRTHACTHMHTRAHAHTDSTVCVHHDHSASLTLHLSNLCPPLPGVLGGLPSSSR